MQIQVETMIEKLNHMSPQRLAEISDFIDFLQQRDQNLRLKRDFSKGSETAFAKVWDNEEDSAYDAL
ncbi:MAG: hypothetical protein PF447_04595 [Spirochaetaceae bacterium]|nr:hypothetical protein [Spirochaetaceae bacterium]